MPSKGEADKGFHAWLVNSSEVNCLPVVLKSKPSLELIKVPKVRNGKAWCVDRSVVFASANEKKRLNLKIYSNIFFSSTQISASAVLTLAALLLTCKGNKMLSQPIKPKK